MVDLEERYGKPIEQVIVDAVTAHGSVPRAARELGVKHFTLYGWIRYLRISLRRVATVA